MVRKGHDGETEGGSFWDADRSLFLDLNGGFMDVHFTSL